jgi:hypothetical protein
VGRTGVRSEVTAVLAELSENRAAMPSERRREIAPFLLGTAVGGIAGAIVGVLLGRATSSLLAGLLQLFGRRFSGVEREELRFELLLQ